MHFVKEITILLRHGMGLHLIRSNGQNLATMKNDAAMPLGSIDAKAYLLCQFIDIARTLNIVVHQAPVGPSGSSM
jgi:hypothetical protein